MSCSVKLLTGGVGGGAGQPDRQVGLACPGPTTSKMLVATSRGRPQAGVARSSLAGEHPPSDGHARREGAPWWNIVRAVDVQATAVLEDGEPVAIRLPIRRRAQPVDRQGVAVPLQARAFGLHQVSVVEDGYLKRVA